MESKNDHTSSRWNAGGDWVGLGSVNPYTVQAELVINGKPKLLFSHGEFREKVMRECRITKDEIFASIRKQQVGDTALVEVVVLETDGSVSVILKESAGNRSAVGEMS